jgi:hypothetical protein
MSASVDAQTLSHKKNIISKSKTVIINGHISKRDILCAAETLYSEARGESLTGQLAVGATIVNRSKLLNKTACKVVKQQYTQKRIPVDDKKEFHKLATNILYGNVKNPIGKLDSFDSFKHKRHPRHSVHIGNHWFYKSMS